MSGPLVRCGCGMEILSTERCTECGQNYADARRAYDVAAMECRHCHRRVGEVHKVRCPHNRHSQGTKMLVEERQCHVLTIKEGREIALQLVQIKNRLGQLGLYRTMQKLDLATNEIGYELAEHPEFQQ